MRNSFFLKKWSIIGICFIAYYFIYLDPSHANDMIVLRALIPLVTFYFCISLYFLNMRTREDLYSLIDENNKKNLIIKGMRQNKDLEFATINDILNELKSRTAMKFIMIYSKINNNKVNMDAGGFKTAKELVSYLKFANSIIEHEIEDNE